MNCLLILLFNISYTFETFSFYLASFLFNFKDKLIDRKSWVVSFR